MYYGTIKIFLKLFIKQVNKLNLRFVFKKYMINNTKPLDVYVQCYSLKIYCMIIKNMIIHKNDFFLKYLIKYSVDDRYKLLN